MFKRWEWFVMGVLATSIVFQALDGITVRPLPTQGGLAALYTDCNKTHKIKITKGGDINDYSYECL